MSDKRKVKLVCKPCAMSTKYDITDENLRLLRCDAVARKCSNCGEQREVVPICSVVPRLTVRDYADAINVQDACNLSGVLYSFEKVVDRIEATFKVHPEAGVVAGLHPIAVLYVSKIVSLTKCGVVPFVVDPREVEKGYLNGGGGLRLYVRCFTAAMKQLRPEMESLNLNNTDFINTHPICKWFAGGLVQLTNAEDVQHFSLAYEACQHVARSKKLDFKEYWLLQTTQVRG